LLAKSEEVGALCEPVRLGNFGILYFVKLEGFQSYDPNLFPRLGRRRIEIRRFLGQNKIHFVRELRQLLRILFCGDLGG
jgi:hypothetical protein